MLTQVWSEPYEVDTALKRLRLSRESLLEAVRAGFLERASCTPNDAPFYPALAQWAITLRTLREKLISDGWSKSDDGNYSVVIDPEDEIAIAVASGNSNTGLYGVGMVPTTKSPKGPSTLSAVYVNAELIGDLFPDLIPTPQVHESDKRVTWLLLMHTAEDELRAELSLPASMGHDGRIDAWKERIILPSTPLDPIESIDFPDFGPDLEVDVRRRA